LRLNKESVFPLLGLRLDRGEKPTSFLFENFPLDKEKVLHDFPNRHVSLLDWIHSHHLDFKAFFQKTSQGGIVKLDIDIKSGMELVCHNV
jgi:hypothetical protein